MRGYRTIVADPPWPIRPHGARKPSPGSVKGDWPLTPKMPYEVMSIEEITNLPVAALADTNAHLYLWAINEFLRDAYAVAEAWGFRPGSLLTWCKRPRGLGFGGAYVNTTEFIVFCRRGSLAPSRRWDSTWFDFKRPEDRTGPCHSRKPDGFLDVVEQVSPGPYLEMFARRARFGWDYWGDQSLGTAEMPERAA